MKIILISLALISFAYLGESAVGFLPNATADGYPNSCVLNPDESENRVVIPLGGSINDDGKCRQLTCGYDYTLSFYSCGTVGGPDNCYVSDTDYTKSYPECCPKLICPDAPGTTTISNDI